MLCTRPAEIKLNGTLTTGSSVTIKLLQDYPMLDQEFTKARIDMLLHSPLELFTPVRESSLTLETLKEMRSSLDTRSNGGPRPLSQRRQMYVLDKIIKNYTTGAIAVTNSELLRYLKTKTDNVPNGYQISSHAEDITKLLGPGATVERSRNGVQIRWMAG